MEDYKPNSHRFKEEQKELAAEPKKVEKVVQGVAKAKKKSEVRKLTEVFVAEDMRKVGSFVVMDILVPAAKKTLSDIVAKGLDMMLWGDGGSRDRRSSNTVSYRDYYDRRDGRSSSRFDDDSGRTRSRGFSFDEIVYESRGEAERVLDEMDALIERYGVVRVADQYDLSGLTQPYTSNSYGWSNIRNAEVSRVSDGYIIRLPKARPLD